MDIHCTPSCLVLTWIFFDLPMVYPWFTPSLRPCCDSEGQPNSQPSLQPKHSAQTVTPFSLDLASSGQGRSFGPASKTTWHFAQFKLSMQCATSGKSKRIKKAQHGKTWIKHWKRQRVLQSSKNATPTLAFVAFRPFNFLRTSFEYPCLHPLATDPAVAVFVEEILLQPIHTCTQGQT